MAAALLLSCALGHCAELAPDSPLNFSKPVTANVPIELTADSLSAASNGWVVAEGNVLVRYADAQVTADRLMVNKNSGSIVAEGNVILVREGQGATRTERLEFNYKTGEGLTPKIDVQSAAFRVMAEKAKRLGDGSYELYDVKVTTCTNDESCLHYHVKAKQAFFMPEQYVILKRATSYFKGLPLGYLPTVKKSLVDHFGWRFIPGYESDWGGYLLTTYKRQLVDFGGPFHDSVDSFTEIDYRTERGFALGEDIGWHFGENKMGGGHYGRVGIYGIFDDNPMDEDYDREPNHDIAEENRYRATISANSALTEADSLALRASYLSDSYVLHDFYEDEYKHLYQPDSYATYAHIGEGWSGGIGIYHRINEFYDSINRMPDAWVDVLNTQIGDTPFYYESQTAGGVLQREFADYDNSTNDVPESYDSLRIDSRHAIYMPEKVFGFLSLVPRAVYRGTYYGKTREAREVEEFDGTNTLVSTVYEESGAKLRNLFELGFETSFKAYGIYEDEVGRVRHIVEPYANYTLIPEPNVRPGELYKFDSVDRLDKANYVKFGVRQYLQRKVEESTVNRIYADIYGIYDIEDANDESGMRKIGLESEFRPTDSIRAELDAVYDAQDSELDNVDLWLTLWQGDSWEAAGEFYYRPDICAQYAGAISVNFSEHWGAKIYARYDSELARLEQIAGHIQYNLDCLSFRLRGSYEPSFTRDDGSEREAKIRVSFYTWLRAFPESRYERKMHEDVDYMDD
jgi:lipopolysaccharide assembly outer membrane protein LptD (OstA)